MSTLHWKSLEQSYILDKKNSNLTRIQPQVSLIIHYTDDSWL